MIAGKEGRHAWTPAGAEDAAVTLGLIRDDEGKEVWPRYRIRRIGGLSSGGDGEDNRDPRAGSAGEIARHSQRRGKSVTYEGVIEARGLKEMREARDALVAAFDSLDEGRMDVTWHPSNVEFAGETPKFYEARALTCEVVEELQGRRWVWPFVIGLRMSDRRHFDEETEIYTVELAETATAEEFTE
jgi:hypothetical protein